MQSKGYPISTFAAMLGGQWLHQAIPEAHISHLLTDSRFYQNQEDSVFFAITSRRNDGHKYVEALKNRGLKNFVVSQQTLAEQLKDVNVILVDDTVAALQLLAKKHREQFSIPVLGITGSNGKTVVKEWLYQLLQKHRRTIRSPRSYNSQIGVPMSAWLMGGQHEIAILEAGISAPGEMEKIAKVIQPSIGIFTNIGEAHQEYFDTVKQKVEEKAKLFKGAKCIIYNKDQPTVAAVLEQAYGDQDGVLKAWSAHGPAVLEVMKVETAGQHTTLLGKFEGRHAEIVLPFIDPASIENACHCWLFMLLEGFSDEAITLGMESLTPIAMRLEQLDGIQGSTLINDVYNSDFNSLEIAIDQLMLQRKNSRYTAIISDLVQSGEEPTQLYARLAKLITAKGVTRFIGVGENLFEQQHFFKDTTAQFYKSTESFLADFRHSDFAAQNILVKGARQFAFERISDILSEKTHETILEIDLERIRDNLNYIRTLLLPSTGIMVMVKAFGYGSGTYEVARTLEFHGVQYLAVAYADEGITLRESGINIPILVLNPEVSSYDAMIRYKLEPQIYSFRTLKRFSAALFGRESHLPYPIHIKLNTGMNRLGFDLNELEELAGSLSANEAVRVETVFSHLAASESPEFDGLSQKQINRFEQGVGILKESLVGSFRTHLLNSQGIFRFNEQQRDYVRLGLALYGISSNPAFRKHLKPVSRLITVVSQLREVSAGEGVGYSPKHFLTKSTTVAVIPIGYADGLPRALSNGVGFVLIRGKRCPFIGNICMDMAMVDVSMVNCQEGDEVEVFGEHMDIYEMSNHLNTIPYEVLTNISQRVKRVYLHQ
jgi:alanine racemase